MEAIIYDTSLIFAIIAINMTVIGLTSLADMKSVVGIDYANFLLRKYKILGFIRIYHLLILFGIINVVALFLILIPNYHFRLIYFWCLIVSLIFAIYYFFAYIIIESNRVKKQVYEQEILGFYYNSSDPTTFPPDIFTKVNDGSRTTKKMSGNFIEYFNTYTTDSSDSFVELFGPDSLIYNYSKRLNRKRKQKFNVQAPYVYRQSIHKTQEISHEFFQMYRYSNIQDRWLLTVLDAFETPYSLNKFDYIRLTNFTRVIGQINAFGTSPNLFKAKFLEHLFLYYKKALYCPLPEQMPATIKNEIISLALYTHGEFIKFMFKTYMTAPEPFYLQTIRSVLSKNLLSEKEFLLSPKEQILQLAQQVTLIKNEELKELFSEVLQDYLAFQNLNEHLPKVSLSEVKEIIRQTENKNSDNISSIKEMLFN